MKTRNEKNNQGFSRIYSVRAIALALSLILSAAGASSANALDACATDPHDFYCSIDIPKSYQVVVNKIRPLNPLNFAPKDLKVVPKYNPYGLRTRKTVSAALVSLGNAMKSAGKGTLVIQSAYRSYKTQVSVHSRQVKTYGLKKGENLAARPGFSEHQTGMAVDVAGYRQGCSIQVCFSKTKAGKWLAANSYKYGFVLRYPSGKTSITGYQFEPWHFRFVGVDLATKMHDRGISTLETYFGLTSAPNYLN